MQIVILILTAIASLSGIKVILDWRPKISIAEAVFYGNKNAPEMRAVIVNTSNFVIRLNELKLLHKESKSEVLVKNIRRMSGEILNYLRPKDPIVVSFQFVNPKEIVALEDRINNNPTMQLQVKLLEPKKKTIKINVSVRPYNN